MPDHCAIIHDQASVMIDQSVSPGPLGIAFGLPGLDEPHTLERPFRAHQQNLPVGCSGWSGLVHHLNRQNLSQSLPRK